jgi:hypothetical protein
MPLILTAVILGVCAVLLPLPGALSSVLVVGAVILGIVGVFRLASASTTAF